MINKNMKTKELPLYGIQSNALGVKIVNETCCRVLLSNGSHLNIECVSKSNANTISNTILYYPVNGRDNNVREFEFEFILNYEK